MEQYIIQFSQITSDLKMINNETHDTAFGTLIGHDTFSIYTSTEIGFVLNF